MATTLYHPTKSQWAAAAMHLDRRDEWRYFRSAGVRYVSIISGRSNRLWIARADADGCGCPWSQNTATPCSHRIALELDALEAELIEARDAAEPVAALFPRCRSCGSRTDQQPCDACTSDETRRLETAGKVALAGSRYANIWTED